uniref:Protein kinase domain-containing protein n=1 Tax=Emiliania huxleyi (strain CCMP1516) TaxID=280463 RepID=A0A0D3K468_EMIH1
MDELSAATDDFAEARKVGEGGFGRVYRADALPSLPRVACGFAVKTALVGVGAQGLAELQSEVRTLSAACHPSLLPLLGACLAPERTCLVYPLCRGGSLEDRLYRTPAALQRLHMLGFETPPPPLSSAARLRKFTLPYLTLILHRDISAGNILLDERGNGYLADVGLARAAEATAGSSQQVSHLSTQRIFGKPGYMDPIIMQDGQASVLTDGYALGITLLVSLTGRGAL